MKKFKILSREKVLKTRWMPIEKQIVELPNGKKSEWFVNTNSDAVVIVPIQKDKQILLQRNYKHGCGEIVTEFCAGMIDAGETPEISASRELLEETGYTAQKFIKIGESFTNPTGAIMKHHFFLAIDCEKTKEPKPEEEEQIETFLVENIKMAEKTLIENQTSSASLSALTFAQYFLKNTENGKN